MPAASPAPDPAASAREARLRYVECSAPGLRREPRPGKPGEFRYRAPDGAVVRDPETLQRIRSLAIPPAWRDVWICADPRGHLQATGIDARGRKQYRYHPRWRAVRDSLKYDRMLAFGAALPTIRERVAHDLRRPGLSREKVLATAVALLEETRIRIGSDEYARQNRSFGLTTLRDRHVREDGEGLRLEFRGKSGKVHHIPITDRRLARLVRRCKDLPGQQLFQYLDEDGQRHPIDSGDVNDYLRAISGGDFTAKDFRTWAGTVLAARALRDGEPAASEAEAKRRVVEAVRVVAEQLGNTPAVCRKAYVHPAVIDAYTSGLLEPNASRDARRPPDAAPPGLSEEEASVLALLRRLKAGAGTEQRSAA